MKSDKLDIYILYPQLMKFEKIIHILNSNKRADGYSYISQKEIGMALNLHQTAISKYMRRLQQYDQCIEKVRSGVYIVQHDDMSVHGPVSKVMKYHLEVIKDISILKKTFEKQKELLNFNFEELTFARSHFQLFLDELDEAEGKNINEVLLENFKGFLSRYNMK